MELLFALPKISILWLLPAAGLGVLVMCMARMAGGDDDEQQPIELEPDHQLPSMYIVGGKQLKAEDRLTRLNQEFKETEIGE